MRRIALLTAVTVLAGCGGGSTGAKTASVVKRLNVVIRGDNHHPLVGKKWHYEVRVTADGKPVSCRIHVQFLFGGAPVGEVGRHVLSGGTWQETFGASSNPPFPAASRGQPLVLEVTATKRGYRSARAGWPVVPR
jgi:hypothetical protein